MRDSGLSLFDPLWLLALVPLVPLFIAVARTSLRTSSELRRRLALALRLGVVVAVVLALAGLHAWRREDRLTVLFAVDRSRSVGREAAEEEKRFLDEAARSLPEGDQMGIVTFGREAMVEALPRSRFTSSDLLTRPDPDATDVSAAIRLARGLVPPGHEGRLVLLTDGIETRGSLLEGVGESPSDLDVVWRPLPRSTSPEVLVE
ncbi:MAG TPA: vWA domain-containing protein [Thermoanaerobaculia bacterium]|nr:vWA domain-containing protein [Thermoanaerobaculia bacterium]